MVYLSESSVCDVGVNVCVSSCVTAKLHSASAAAFSVDVGVEPSAQVSGAMFHTLVASGCDDGALHEILLPRPATAVLSDAISVVSVHAGEAHSCASLYVEDVSRGKQRESPSCVWYE